MNTSLIMSIDVFGRVLKHKTSAGARGPPGEGFQRTPHGDFDISHKRLCNVATPQEDLDAVNLRSLKEIQHELESVHTMVKALNATFEKMRGGNTFASDGISFHWNNLLKPSQPRKIFKTAVHA